MERKKSFFVISVDTKTLGIKGEPKSGVLFRDKKEGINEFGIMDKEFISVCDSFVSSSVNEMIILQNQAKDYIARILKSQPIEWDYRKEGCPYYGYMSEVSKTIEDCLVTKLYIESDEVLVDLYCLYDGMNYYGVRLYGEINPDCVNLLGKILEKIKKNF